LVVFLAAAVASASTLITTVPDWNQPAAYGVAGYPNWCTPTAAANLLGWWEDQMGCTGLTDRQVAPASPAYANTAGTWQQGLWHDGTIELGWFMDTGSWMANNGPFPPNAGVTGLNMIGPGIAGFAAAGYNDIGTGITKVSYPNISQGKDVFGTPLATVWANYTAEIDTGRPALLSFDHWVDGLLAVDNQTFPNISVEKYLWDLNSDPHTVTGVGYIDITPGFQNNGQDEWFIAQDNWATTGRYVAVPIDNWWRQTDFVYDVPEPGSLLLVAFGLAFVRRRK